MSESICYLRPERQAHTRFVGLNEYFILCIISTVNGSADLRSNGSLLKRNEQSGHEDPPGIGNEINVVAGGFAPIPAPTPGDCRAGAGVRGPSGG